MPGRRTTIYKVPDLNKAKDRYTTPFGLPPYFDASFYVGCHIESYKLGLISMKHSTDDQPDNNLTNWGIDHVKREYDRLTAWELKN